MKVENKVVALGARFNDVSDVQFDAYTAELAARFEESMQLVNAVSLGTSEEIKGKGDVVKVKVAGDLGEMDELEIDGESTATNYKARAVDVKLTTHGYKEFTTSDREMATSLLGDFTGDAGAAAIDSIGSGIKTKLIAEIVRNCHIVSGEANGNTRTKSDIIAVRKVQNLSRVPQKDRFLALHSDTEADLLDQLSDNSKTGEPQIWNGHIGSKFQYNIFSDTALPYQISGGAGSAYTVSANVAAGSNVVQVAGETGGFAVGDVVSFAGVSGTYIAQEALVGNGELTIFPALAGPVAANAAVTCKDSHALDIAFHKSAIAIASRKLERPDVSSGAMISDVMTPRLNIPLRFVKWYNPASGKTHVKIEVLFGVKTVDSTRMARMLSK